MNLVQVSGGANEGSTNNSASGSRPGAQHQSSAVSLGGQPETTNDSLIDGVDNNERLNSQIALHPSVDAIEEVQVLASAYLANLGHAGGGVINVVTKSGTDRFHGSLYEYFRNDVLDAYAFQFGAHNSKPELRQNQFGGSLGGPLGGHKTYFFGDYEGFRLIQGRAPVELTVPTAYEHDHPGDSTDVGGPLLTHLDPAGLAYFKLYPLPNVFGSANQSAGGGDGFVLVQNGTPVQMPTPDETSESLGKQTIAGVSGDGTRTSTTIPAAILLLLEFAPVRITRRPMYMEPPHHAEEAEIELIADYACDTGENPLWDPMERRLYWCDIPSGRIFRYDPGSRIHENCYEGRAVGGFTIQSDGSLLLFMDRGAIAIWRDGELTGMLPEIEAERSSRFNDVIADPRGRVFCGTMSSSASKGRLYRLDTDGSLHSILEGIGCSNGMAFTLDQKGFYYTDSFAREIYLFDYNVEDGTICNQRILARFDEEDGLPDGITLDAE